MHNALKINLLYETIAGKVLKNTFHVCQAVHRVLHIDNETESHKRHATF